MFVNRKSGFRILIFVSAAILAPIMLGAQPIPVEPAPEELLGHAVRIQTDGGGIFQGTLFAISDERVELVESDGLIVAIRRSQIVSVVEISMEKGARSLYQDSASNRLMFIPTGFAMEPGELHISDTELLFVTASYGLDDHVSFWAGISPLGAIASARAILPLNASMSASIGLFTGIEWLSTLGEPIGFLFLPYLLVSWGEPENNFTFGASWAFSASASGGFNSMGAVAVVGGKAVLTATTALVSENWLVWAEPSADQDWRAVPLYGIFGLAFRIAGNRMSWDIGAVLPLDFADGINGIGDGPVIPLPWLSLTYRIN